MRRWFNWALLAFKQCRRHPLRSGLTVIGVATGMFLFTCVETMQQAVAVATQQSAGDDLLVVYRENRFCPFTSRLPEHYQNEIERIDGVASVVPMKVVVNNCNTSLDVVTFRGLPRDDWPSLMGDEVEIIDGSLSEWQRRDDAALVGDVLARRRGLSPGDRFDAAGVTASVAAIISSERAQDRDVAYVHLPFLQQAASGGLGEVTQFLVRVDDPSQMDAVAGRIDARFASDQDPTHTRPEKAFVAQTAKDLLGLVGFTRWVALGAVLAVLALVANTVLLAVRSRVTEHAILSTIGFRDRALIWMVVVEAVLLALAGGLLGIAAAYGLLHGGGYSLASEGLSMVFEPTAAIVLGGMALSLGLGLLAGLAPALVVRSQTITDSLRMA